MIGWYEASNTFDQINPVMKSTLSRFSISSATWRPTSGLNWSSPYTISPASAADLAVEHAEREIGRILHVFADDAGRSAQGRDKADFHLLL